VKEDWVKYKKLALTIDWKKKIYKIPISNIDEDKFSWIYSKETLTYKINNLVTKNERYESYLTKDNNHKLSNEQIEDIITNSKNSQYYLKNKTEIKNKQKKEYYDNIRNHWDKLEEEHIFTLWVKVADKIHNIKTIIGSGCTTEKWRERIDEAYTYLLNPLKKLKENDKYDQYKLFERVHNDLAQKYNNVDKYVNFVEEQE
jgi:hypothetical protein